MVARRLRCTGWISGTLVAASLLGACGKADREPVPESAFVDRLVDSLCTILSRCCSRGGYSVDGAVCRENLLSDTRAEVETYDRSRIRYDATAAADCIENVDATFSDCTAEQDLDDVAGCDRVFAGLVPAGGACDSGNECAR